MPIGAVTPRWWCVVANAVTQNGSADQNSCWCCGQEQASDNTVHLGEHPAVEVCLPCAHIFHQQAQRAAKLGRLALRRLACETVCDGSVSWVMRYGFTASP